MKYINSKEIDLKQQEGWHGRRVETVRELT